MVQAALTVTTRHVLKVQSAVPYYYCTYPLFQQLQQQQQQQQQQNYLWVVGPT